LPKCRTSGRHCIFFEANEARDLIVRVLHNSMDLPRHLSIAIAPGDEGGARSSRSFQDFDRPHPARHLVPTRENAAHVFP
jgi:hypothetical protein